MARLAVCGFGSLGDEVLALEAAEALRAAGFEVRSLSGRHLAQQPTSSHATPSDAISASTHAPRVRALTERLHSVDAVLASLGDTAAIAAARALRKPVIALARDPSCFAHEGTFPVVASSSSADRILLACSRHYDAPLSPLHPTMRLLGAWPTDAVHRRVSFAVDRRARRALLVIARGAWRSHSFLRPIAEAARRVELELIIDVGSDFIDAGGELAARLGETVGSRVELWPGATPRADFSAVRAMVHAGGIGSVTAACWLGVPGVALASRREHVYHGVSMRRLGVGTALSLSSLGADNLASALAARCLAPEPTARAIALGEQLRADDGRTALVGLIRATLDGLSRDRSARDTPRLHAAPPPPTRTIAPVNGRRVALFWNAGFAPWRPPTLEGLDPPWEATDDQDRLREASVVFFHVPTLVGVPRVPKFSGQRWAMWSAESSVNYPLVAAPAFVREFELSATYRRDSTVPQTYVDEAAYLATWGATPANVEGSDGDLASMFISSAVDPERLRYAEALMRELGVASFGRALRNRELPSDRGRATKLEVLHRYPFHLAFENSRAHDYVTEKLFDCFAAGTVPVYWGAPNASEFMPSPESWVDATAFADPADLARHLRSLAADSEAYARCHAWRDAPPSPSVNALLRTLGPRRFLHAMLERVGRDDPSIAAPAASDSVPFAPWPGEESERYIASAGRGLYADAARSLPAPRDGVARDVAPTAARPLRIISFSLWGSDPRYLQGALANARLAAEVYPEWTCRFYVGTDVSAEVVSELSARSNCEVTIVEDESPGWGGLFWRFRAAADPRADAVLVRDTDSRLGYRERLAVDAWIASGRSFHVMRDNTVHHAPILGGMWGARGGLLPDIESLCRAWTTRDRWNDDQLFLAEVIYPRVSGDMTVHDEFLELRPFPSSIKRDPEHYVGRPYGPEDRSSILDRERVWARDRLAWKAAPVPRRPAVTRAPSCDTDDVFRTPSCWPRRMVIGAGGTRPIDALTAVAHALHARRTLGIDVALYPYVHVATAARARSPIDAGRVPHTLAFDEDADDLLSRRIVDLGAHFEFIRRVVEGADEFEVLPDATGLAFRAAPVFPALGPSLAIEPAVTRPRLSDEPLVAAVDVAARAHWSSFDPDGLLCVVSISPDDDLEALWVRLRSVDCALLGDPSLLLLNSIIGVPTWRVGELALRDREVAPWSWDARSASHAQAVARELCEEVEATASHPSAR